MNYKNKKLQINQVDEQLETFTRTYTAPAKGWIHTIRTSLSMTAAQLANRLGVSPQSVLAIEKREKEGKITLETLRRVGAAMELKLVYGFVPNGGTLEKMIEEKAKELAFKIVMRTSTQMALEDQKISDQKLKKAIEERTQEIVRTLPKNIWD
jgi:predicted DNA-binding mobile mystery protein A